jgi:4-hydroxybutyryl-CoA dehydratase/vinylacetyl-CoA-Delta-isomerase
VPVGEGMLPAIQTAEEYLDSLRGRGLKVYLFGELLEEAIDHPMIAPSVNAVAETFRLGQEQPELGTALSPLSGYRCNRFLHITTSADDVVMQNKMQRALGQRTGTCFQRCVGMDAINSCFSITYDIDAKHGTRYHQQFRDFIGMMQRQNYVLGGAMTDPKGDRSKGPTGQTDPDLFVRVVERRVDGLVIRGAKMHQTGCINAHWLLTMPGGRMASGDEDYASICALPVDSPGLSFIYGRQSCDTRAIELDGECGVAWSPPCFPAAVAAAAGGGVALPGAACLGRGDLASRARRRLVVGLQAPTSTRATRSSAARKPRSSSTTSSCRTSTSS